MLGPFDMIISAIVSMAACYIVEVILGSEIAALKRECQRLEKMHLDEQKRRRGLDGRQG